MKLLVDIGHPAHVHLFKGVSDALLSKGWDVLFSVRVKGENSKLIEAYEFKFEIYGKTHKTIPLKVFSVIHKNLSLYRIIKSFNPSITISHSSFYLSQVSWYCSIPNITLEDTGNMEQIMLYLPFTNVILTPESYHRNHGTKHIRYHGFHENAYIHTDLQKLNASGNVTVRDTILIRLVDWAASHDIGQDGLSLDSIYELLKIRGAGNYIKILSERPLPEDLKQYELIIQPQFLHKFLQHVRLYIGEGATLASECALQGIPAIYINSLSAGVIQEKVKAGLMYHFKTNDDVIRKAKELIDDPGSYDRHMRISNEYLENQIDLSKFLTWFVEKWPESFQIMKTDPDYQYNYKH